MKKRLLNIIDDKYLSKSDKLDILRAHIEKMPSLEDKKVEEGFDKVEPIIIDKEEK